MGGAKEESRDREEEIAMSLRYGRGTLGDWIRFHIAWIKDLIVGNPNFPRRISTAYSWPRLPRSQWHPKLDYEQLTIRIGLKWTHVNGLKAAFVFDQLYELLP